LLPKLLICWKKIFCTLMRFWFWHWRRESKIK